MFGKLTLEAIPYHEPIIMGAAAFMAILALGTVAASHLFRQVGLALDASV